MTRRDSDELYDAFMTVLADSEARVYGKYIRQIIRVSETLDTAGLNEAIRKTPMPAEYGEKVAFVARLLMVFDGLKDERFSALVSAYNSDAVIPYVRYALKQFDAGKTPPVSPSPVSPSAPMVGLSLPVGREVIVEMPRIATPLEIGRVAGTYARMGLAEEDIRSRLARQFGSTERAIRTARTEIHVHIEEEKLEQASSAGIKKKVWRTQRDADVRDTPFHNLVADKRVNIREAFDEAGMKAWAPGDFRLPAGERINCRCYLEYE